MEEKNVNVYARWLIPTKRVVKCNVHSFFSQEALPNGQHSGIGVVFRDCLRVILHMTGGSLRFEDQGENEFHALLEGLVDREANELDAYLAEYGANHWDRIVIIERDFGRIEEIWYLDMGLGNIDQRFRAVRQSEIEADVMEDEVIDPQEDDLPQDAEINVAQDQGFGLHDEEVDADEATAENAGGRDLVGLQWDYLQIIANQTLAVQGNEEAERILNMVHSTQSLQREKDAITAMPSTTSSDFELAEDSFGDTGGDDEEDNMSIGGDADVPAWMLIKEWNKSFLWLGPKPLVHITDPDLIKEVLNKFNNFQKPRGGNPLINLIASGLAIAEGDKWAEHRKIMNPAFRFEKLKDMVPAIYLSCSEITSKWEEMVSTEGQCELDVWPYFETLTRDVISRTSFGSSYAEGRKIFQLQKELAELVMQAVQTLYLPGMRYLPTKRNRRMKEIDNEVRSALKTIINKRLKAMQAGECKNDDLLGLLLESNSAEIKENKNMKYGMTVDDVVKECKLFYFAGQETTSDLLVWTMILLSQHSYWQERAREEVLQAFGSNKPDLDGLNRLKVVNMILLETLRLYPPGVVITRAIFEDTKLGEIALPAGVLLHLPVILLHHDKEIWGDDAKEFNPVRFSDGVLKATNGKPGYFPFSSGPRICIGQNLAMLEAKMAISMFLQRFSFVLSPLYTHAPYTVITLQPQYGANLILKAL
ncbi:cytochrome P450 CYP72A219-like [Apium graveolens]|uniref:cytochrome P450 CYP72A219-like n=1 Tax=Apium graveolens TaxID=4045 RepID=UPI003D79BB9A